MMKLQLLGSYFSTFFQDAATPIMEGIIALHQEIFFYLIIILVFVSWMLFRSFYLFNSKRFYKSASFHEHTVLEVVWTTIPAIILIFIAIPSFTLLYAMDDAIVPVLTVKVTGHQWYWSYEYLNYKKLDFSPTDLKFTDVLDNFLNINKNLESSSTKELYNSLNVDNSLKMKIVNFLNKKEIENAMNTSIATNYKSIANNPNFIYDYPELLSNSLRQSLNLSFDSYLLKDADLENIEDRLLEVDIPLILPVKTHIRLIFTSTDVIHSWTIPSFGVKIDCVPGRLSQASLYISRPGVFYGQCSEICGEHHGFMPITVFVYNN